MPKKKAAVSGFTILMKELQEKYAREGRRVPPLKDMKDIAEPIWRSKSEAEKFEYNQKAKAYKNQLRKTAQKLASDGTVVEENMEKELEEENQVNKMIADIRHYINVFVTPEEFKASARSRKIYVMCFNIMCVTDDNEYVPLEVGIAEFSVSNGISRSYHKFIHPGQPPSGCAGQAKEHSEETHKIPFSGHPDSERNYEVLWEEICQFLCPSGLLDIPPIFCLKNHIKQTDGCLRWIMEKACTQDQMIYDLRVWDLGQLLHEMRSAVGQMIVSAAIATSMLQKSTFDFEPDTRCFFHEELDSAHCALGCTKRLCFLMADCLCEVFDVTPTEKHLPLRTSENKGYEIFIPRHNDSKNFLESEVPRKISSRASEVHSVMSSQISESSRISSRISDTSEGYGLDTFSDDDDESYYSFTTEVMKAQRTPLAPVPQMAQMNLRSATESASAMNHVRNPVMLPANQISSSAHSLSVASGGDRSEHDHRQPRMPASAFSQLRFKTANVALGRGIGRGRSQNQ